MSKYIGLFIEYIISWIIIPIMLYFIIKIPMLQTILNSSDKTNLLVNTYSILIGFVITSTSIFASLSSKPLVNISKKQKVLGLIFIFSITLISMFLVLGGIIFSIDVKIFKGLLIFSIAQIFQYHAICLTILYLSLSDLNNDVRQKDEFNNLLKSEIRDIKRLLELIGNKK